VSLFDYQESSDIVSDHYSFNAVIMAAFRLADMTNAEKLISAFPDICAELQERCDSPDGKLKGE